MKQLQPYDFEVVVVADGSTDRTVEIAEAFNVIVVSPKKRLGKGGGFLQGFLHSNKDPVFLVDVDLPVPLDYLSFFKDLLKVYDVVIGSRYLDLSENIGLPMTRRVLSEGFRLFCKILFRLGIEDFQCGFKGFRRKVIQDIFNDMVVHGFVFDVEVLVRASGAGFTIAEIPVEYRFDRNSKVKLLNIPKMFKDVIRIYARRH